MSEEHPDVTGGWLRPAVFGAMDGLVSNFALAMGVAGGSSNDTRPIILAGFAGLVAGALSMAAGEYTSVASQAEFVAAQIAVERREILEDDAGEQAELAGFFEAMGVEPATAHDVAAQIHQRTEDAVRVHAMEELGVDVDNIASPVLAAGSSFLSFALGALLPILPFVLGFSNLVPTIVVSLAALFACGAVVTTITKRPWWFGGLRQLALGAAAALVTYGIGSLVGASVG